MKATLAELAAMLSKADKDEGEPVYFLTNEEPEYSEEEMGAIVKEGLRKEQEGRGGKSYSGGSSGESSGAREGGETSNGETGGRS